MQTVTIQRTSRAHYAASFTGFGGTVYQPSVTIITTHIAGESIEIVDTAVTSHVHNLMGNMIALDMTDLTPAELTTHDAIAGYWFAVARGWAMDVQTEGQAA